MFYFIDIEVAQSFISVWSFDHWYHIADCSLGLSCYLASGYLASGYIPCAYLVRCHYICNFDSIYQSANQLSNIIVVAYDNFL